REPTLLEKLNAKVIYTSSDQSGYEGQKAIDGDPATMWHTRWSPQATPRPHEIRIELSRPATITGITVLPRQDSNSNGRIAEYEVYVSTDPATWGPPAAKGRFENNAALQTARFDMPHRGRFVRLVSLGGFDDDPHTSAAHINLLSD
ncbi:MAG TPA: discoidin domain-containing protein, partial [Phycisphaerales bacterium]|nr:discoidin domain-containing protein [Phycisphaerales bacterium]